MSTAAPNSTRIEGYPDSPPREGDVLNLVCRSRGGNPPPNLIWLRDGVPLPAEIITQRTKGKTRLSTTSTTIGFFPLLVRIYIYTWEFFYNIATDRIMSHVLYRYIIKVIYGRLIYAHIEDFSIFRRQSNIRK